MAPVLHEYVPLPDAVSVVEGLMQVRVNEDGVMAATGGVWFSMTDALAEAVQPLEAVTVRE